jgi:hypothetical protein
LLAPKYQTVVEAKRKYPGHCEKYPISSRSRELKMAQANDDEKNRAGDDKPDTCKGERRQISETELDEQPGRSPDATKYEPNETRFQSRFPIADLLLYIRDSP